MLLVLRVAAPVIVRVEEVVVMVPEDQAIVPVPA